MNGKAIFLSKSFVIASLAMLTFAGSNAVEAASVKKAAQNDASCGSVNVPKNIRAGDSFAASFNMKNTGKKTWTKKDYGLKASLQNVGAYNIKLPKNVNAKKSQSFILMTNAPTSAGTYELTWQMTNKGGAFGETCRTTVTVKALQPSSSSSSSKSSSSISSVQTSSTQSVSSSSISTSSTQNSSIHSSSAQSSSAQTVSSSSVSTSSAQSSAPVVTAFFEYALMGGLQNDTVVKNQKNISVLAFNAQSGGAETVLTKASFRAVQGSLLNAQNYSLWVDTDKNGTVDTVLKANVAPSASLVTFDALTYVTAVEGDIRFEVHADIASSLVNNQLQLDFATDTPIEAKSVSNGTPVKVNRWGSVAATLFTIRNQGDLFVTKNVTPLRSHQLLGGTLGESILILTFSAQFEDIDVTDLQLTSFASSATSVDRLELYFDGATSPFAIATVGGCGSDQVPTVDNGINVQTFCANMESRQLIVAKGMTKNVTVRPRIKTDDQGATSGQTFGIFVHENNQNDNTTGVGAVRARGSVSSNNLIGNDQDSAAEGEVFIGTGSPAANIRIKGEANTVVFSKIVSIANGGPATGTVQEGVQQIGAFTFGAAQNANTMNGTNRATLNDIIFLIDGQNVMFGGYDFKVYNAADTSVKARCFLMTFGGNEMIGAPTMMASGGFVRCTNLRASGVNTSIDSGSQMTLVLEANIVDMNYGTPYPSKVQVILQRFNDPTLMDTMMAPGRNIEWIDEDVNQTTHRWIEYNVPTPNNAVRSTLYE